MTTTTHYLQRPKSHLLFFFLLTFCIAAAGCTFSGGKSSSLPYKGGRKAPPPTYTPQKPLFHPLNKSGAFRLTHQEAVHMAKNMHPKQQGLASWKDMHFALGQSLAHAKAKAADSYAFERPGLRVTYGQLAETLQHLQTLLPRLDGNPALIASEFHWYRIGPDFGLTGYFEPTLKASRRQSHKYNYPLYKTPPDLRKGVPYHTRNSIDRKGALRGKGLEIAWVDSEVDAFFLHIQGSGRLQFEDGNVTHILYANKNNRAYVPLGRVMRDEGLLDPDNISMQTIVAALEQHSHRAAELMDKNPSYIFFREAQKGPLGAMGRPLTPWVSIATDRKVLPHGTLLFTIVPLPDASGAGIRPFHALTLPQDTGGAIKGNRIDLFCGPGEKAKHTSGLLDTKGAVFLLVKK